MPRGFRAWGPYGWGGFGGYPFWGWGGRGFGFPWLPRWWWATPYAATIPYYGMPYGYGLGYSPYYGMGYTPGYGYPAPAVAPPPIGMPPPIT